MLKSPLFPLESQITWRSLLNPAVAISMGLHALLFIMPLPTGKSPQPTAETEVETRITRLSTLSPSPAPLATPPPQSVPQAVPQTVSQPSVLPSPLPAALPLPLASRQPALPNRPMPVSQPAAPQKRSSLRSPAPAPPASPTPAPPATPPAAAIRLPFGDFPHLAGSQAGCFGEANCHQLRGNFRATAQTLVSQMEQQGYQVKVRRDLEDNGQQIIELTAADGTTRFLSVLSDNLDSTVYLLGPQYITLADLKQVDSVRSTLEQQLDQVSPVAATATVFPYPTAFFNGTAPLAGIQGRMRLVASQSANQMPAALANQLQSSGFSLSPIGSYGGGSLYEVSRKAFTGYLSFVPTQDSKGTIVVLWQTLPQ